VRILSVVGARPDFVRAAPVSRAIRERHEEIPIHIGQHCDCVTQAFFDELQSSTPHHTLEDRSGVHILGGRASHRIAVIADGLST
jgi:UDP-N-acetylglucosamine 2-epimerase